MERRRGEGGTETEWAGLGGGVGRGGGDGRALLERAAAPARSLQSCPTLCDPIDGSPPGSPVPGILQARVLEWGAIAFSMLERESRFKERRGRSRRCYRVKSLETLRKEGLSRGLPNAHH